MGRIVTPVTISSFTDPTKTIRCDALVDTGASPMVLPSAWKDRLGPFPQSEEVTLDTAAQTQITGLMCGPVKVQVEGFRAISTEVLFLDMTPLDGQYEPLVGYLVLEALPVAVDLLGHRLVQVKSLDLKAARFRR